MSLPTLTVPYYEMTVSSTGKKIKYRPFLVKEEKLLLMALESKNDSEMFESIKQTIDNCVQGGFDTNIIPLFDLEYIYLKIRSKSIGERAKVNFLCTECKETNVVTIDFDAVKIDKSRGTSSKVEIDITTGIVMKYPNMNISLQMVKETPSTEDMFEFVLSCIDYVYDKDQIHKAQDYSRKDLYEFVEGVSSEVFAKMVDYIDKMPNLSYKTTFKCKKCEQTNKVEVTESADFFS